MASEKTTRPEQPIRVLAYQVLTGAMVMAHMVQPPPDLRALNPDLPERTANAIIRAMSKKPEQRFDTAREFTVALA